MNSSEDKIPEAPHKLMAYALLPSLMISGIWGKFVRYLAENNIEMKNTPGEFCVDDFKVAKEFIESVLTEEERKSLLREISEQFGEDPKSPFGMRMSPEKAGKGTDVPYEFFVKEVYLRKDTICWALAYHANPSLEATEITFTPNGVEIWDINKYGEREQCLDKRVFSSDHSGVSNNPDPGNTKVGIYGGIYEDGEEGWVLEAEEDTNLTITGVGEIRKGMTFNILREEAENFIGSHSGEYYYSDVEGRHEGVYGMSNLPKNERPYHAKFENIKIEKEVLLEFLEQCNYQPLSLGKALEKLQERNNRCEKFKEIDAEIKSFYEGEQDPPL